MVGEVATVSCAEFIKLPARSLNPVTDTLGITIHQSLQAPIGGTK
jgi:hypothetical protein